LKTAISLSIASTGGEVHYNLVQVSYDSYFLELDDEAVRKMKILIGPKMTEAEKIYLKSLLRDLDLLDNCFESQLRIRQ